MQLINFSAHFSVPKAAANGRRVIGRQRICHLQIGKLLQPGDAEPSRSVPAKSFALNGGVDLRSTVAVHIATSKPHVIFHDELAYRNLRLTWRTISIPEHFGKNLESYSV
jgi:hypothetical protein